MEMDEELLKQATLTLARANTAVDSLTVRSGDDSQRMNQLVKSLFAARSKFELALEDADLRKIVGMAEDVRSSAADLLLIMPRPRARLLREDGFFSGKEIEEERQEKGLKGLQRPEKRECILDGNFEFPFGKSRLMVPHGTPFIFEAYAGSTVKMEFKNGLVIFLSAEDFPADGIPVQSAPSEDAQ